MAVTWLGNPGEKFLGVLLMTFYEGPKAEWEALFKPFFDLKPVGQITSESAFKYECGVGGGV